MGKGTARTYRCPADHKHGATSTCYVHGCGCKDCLRGHRERAAQRRKLIAYGRHESSLVDSRPTIAKIETLRTDEWTWEQIATAAGFQRRCQIQTIMRTRPAHVRRDTEAAILSIATKPAKGPLASIDPTGTRRRLGALARMGWTWTAIGEASGLGPSFVSHAAVGDKRVMVKTADAVRAVYDRLADTPAPDGQGARRARNWAVRHGLHAPIEWTGLDMDDPDVEPEPVEADGAGWSIAEVAHLHALGESPTQAAAQLGAQPDSLATLARRYGRKDLAAWLTEAKRAA